MQKRKFISSALSLQCKPSIFRSYLYQHFCFLNVNHCSYKVLLYCAELNKEKVKQIISDIYAYNFKGQQTFLQVSSRNIITFLLINTMWQVSIWSCSTLKGGVSVKQIIILREDTCKKVCWVSLLGRYYKTRHTVKPLPHQQVSLDKFSLLVWINNKFHFTSFSLTNFICSCGR